jgi:D-threo-aldose 1-dehydrogenase
MKHDPQMQTVTLGRTEVTVTRLGLGLAPIGGLYTAVGDEAARATIEAAWDAGVRFFDTAPLYGHGLSERRAGAVLSAKPRSSFTLSTKVGRRIRSSRPADLGIWGEPLENDVYWDFSRDGAVRSLEESLERLGLDRVDMLHIHDPDDHYADAVAGALPALASLRAAGRIGAVSVGMNQAPMLADFVRTGMVDCVLLAGRYTLLDQRGLDELLPLCADWRVSVIAAGVFNSGILAGGSTFDYAPASGDIRARVDAIRAICDRHGVPLRAAAVQFPLRHTVVACVLLGLRSPAEVSDALAMLGHDIPEDLWRDLEKAALIR